MIPPAALKGDPWRTIEELMSNLNIPDQVDRSFSLVELLGPECRDPPEGGHL